MQSVPLPQLRTEAGPGPPAPRHLSEVVVCGLLASPHGTAFDVEGLGVGIGIDGDFGRTAAIRSFQCMHQQQPANAAIHELARLADHAERAVFESRRNILRGLPDQPHLEIMDCPRPIHGHGSNETTFHQVDEDRS